MILWNRLEHFISGKQHHLLHPCKFNAKVIRQSLLNSIRSPRANNPDLVIRFNLLLSSSTICSSRHLSIRVHHFVIYSMIHLLENVLQCHVCVILTPIMSFYASQSVWPTFHRGVVGLAYTNANLGTRLNMMSC